MHNAAAAAALVLNPVAYFFGVSAALGALATSAFAALGPDSGLCTKVFGGLPFFSDGCLQEADMSRVFVCACVCTYMCVGCHAHTYV